MNNHVTFQEAIQRLQAYWTAHNCLLWQPSNTEVGAGTMNPATFLRVLGRAPWNVAYVEPSVRPDDSRYGDNPNRIQMHTQYQVILKPSPDNPQELYLGSLEALGIDRSKHDIRFVEDNWESPALGAWGLGWEVWLDGLEITQFTYFQQAGGYTLSPVSVEITYGLERILMALQGIEHFKDILFAPGIRYGDVLSQNEYEMSVYNLDVADVERMAQLFEIYNAEAYMLLKKELPIPAYSYVLKASHTFNILDARGAIGVTERARYFARMRDLARQSATLWMKVHSGDYQEEHSVSASQQTISTEISVPSTVADAQHNFVLEIGVEELPADDVTKAIEQLRERVPVFLSELRLSCSEIEIDATPRRLVVFVRGLSAYQSEEDRIVKGPPVKLALGPSGEFNQAALGFARSQGVDVSVLERRTINGTDFLVHVSSLKRESAEVSLTAALPKLVSSLTFPKSMRWNSSNITFSRPIRWYVALLDGCVVPFTYAGIVGDRVSHGLRNSAISSFEVCTADDYKTLLADQGILLSREGRKELIWTEAVKLANEVSGRIPDAAQGDVLEEVSNLVEAPTPIRGSFDPEYLSLPREVLITVMRKHQRYFPVEDTAGNLLPYFITVANGNVSTDIVRTGNEAVLRARYADASFFWKHDTSRHLESFRGVLAGLTFQDQLGSMLQKNERIETLAPTIAKMVGCSEADMNTVRRSAHLAKVDLVTQMVMEFTNLAGIMGRTYAGLSGESPEVGQSIYEHIMPRSVGDKLPRSKPGIALGIADRLDTLVGLFGVGVIPKGTADPFGLRRITLGLIQILIGCEISLDLSKAIKCAVEVHSILISEETEQQVMLFIQRRLQQWFLDHGERYDLVEAVLSERGHNPALALSTLRDLSALVSTEQFERVSSAYSRVAKIARTKAVESSVSVDLFEEPEETALWEAYIQAKQDVSADMRIPDFLIVFDPLVEAINRFFDAVFVMADDAKIRQNRLAVLLNIAGLSNGVVDLTKVQKE